IKSEVYASQVYMEGSPVDRLVFFSLMALGLLILYRRRPAWGELIVKNPWIWLYFLFGGLSILWSDYPLQSLRRLVKALGNVIMALVVLTEKHPYEAV